MGFHLKRRESIARGVRRLAEAELEVARRALHRARQEACVHDVRTSMKKLRALLRLVRPELQSAVFDRENAAFRDISRQLATLRDADALVSTVTGLKPEDSPHAAFDRNLARLRRHKLRVRQEFFDSSARVKSLDVTAEDAASRIRKWTHDSIDSGTLVKGLRRSYRRASKAFESASRSNDDQHWHEWRKRTKDVYYHLHLIERAWPTLMGAALDKYKNLSNSLGMDHDLAIVRHRLADVVPEHDLADERKRIFAIVNRRRRELHASARESGRALFDEKPGDFAERFEACLAVWRK